MVDNFSCNLMRRKIAPRQLNAYEETVDILKTQWELEGKEKLTMK